MREDVGEALEGFQPSKPPDQRALGPLESHPENSFGFIVRRTRPPGGGPGGRCEWDEGWVKGKNGDRLLL